MGARTTYREAALSGGVISYRQCGPDDGRPIVFVHGFLVDETMWADVPERLAEQGFRAIAPTWPLGSHRAAMQPDVDLSPRGIAQIVLSFLDELDLQDVVLVGNDTGGAVCQFLLDTDASRIGAVVLSNCDAFTTFPPAQFKAVFSAGRHPWLAGLILKSMRWRALRHSSFGIGPLAKTFDADQTAGWFAPSIGNPAIRQDIARFLRQVSPAELDGVSTRLNRFEGPVAVVWGEDDRAFRPKLGKRLAAAFRDASFVAVPDARTLLPLDAPERFATEIAKLGSRPT
ncbi:alpha/beta hydrolase [Kribbella albertanoniae]|uniref:Alpha/beta hydrolase n=1 Tax=Kribbella albertanoniae TaxID=1266829 RepID=A0A4V2XMJ6_9ACTN|nr:alpha/beta hydrolase [Kribbella albertanoniae]TDC14576.1 alpha/beta hydrolase [Kribbella albertanoniae]